MTRQEIHKKENKGAATRRVQSALISSVMVAALTAVTPAAQAQTVSHSGRVMISEIKTTKMPIEPRLRTVPPSAAPIFQRAADMVRLAEKRLVSTPSNARPSYASALHDLRHMLVIGGYQPDVAADGSSNIGGTVSAGDVANDVRTLRMAANSAPAGDAQLLNRAANLYAAASRSLMTGDLRSALIDRESTPSLRLLNRTARANQVASATVSHSASNSLPPAPATDRPVNRNARPVTVVIHGGVQARLMARQQGQQALRDLLASEQQKIAASAPTPNVYGTAVNSTPGVATVTSPILAQQDALALAQQQAAWAAYVNQGQNAMYPNVYGTLLGASPLAPFGGNMVPQIPSSLPTLSTAPINAITPSGGIILGPGTALIPNPPVPTQISPLPIQVIPIGPGF